MAIILHNMHYTNTDLVSGNRKISSTTNRTDNLNNFSWQPWPLVLNIGDNDRQ